MILEERQPVFASVAAVLISSVFLGLPAFDRERQS